MPKVPAAEGGEEVLAQIQPRSVHGSEVGREAAFVLLEVLGRRRRSVGRTVVEHEVDTPESSPRQLHPQTFKEGNGLCRVEAALLAVEFVVDDFTCVRTYGCDKPPGSPSTVFELMSTRLAGSRTEAAALVLWVAEDLNSWFRVEADCSGSA